LTARHREIASLLPSNKLRLHPRCFQVMIVIASFAIPVQAGAVRALLTIGEPL
jgi:hypothetical protein